MAKFNLSIITYSKKLLEKEVEYVRVRTTQGDMGILANHTPLVVELDPGEMKIKNEDKEEFYFLSGGFLEVSDNKVNIIADQAIYASDIDYERAKAQAEEARKAMELTNEDEQSFVLAERKLKEALLKMNIRGRI